MQQGLSRTRSQQIKVFNTNFAAPAREHNKTSSSSIQGNPETFGREKTGEEDERSSRERKKKDEMRKPEKRRRGRRKRKMLYASLKKRPLRKTLHRMWSPSLLITSGSSASRERAHMPVCVGRALDLFTAAPLAVSLLGVAAAKQGKVACLE